MKTTCAILALACPLIFTMSLAAQQPAPERPNRGRGGLGITAEALQTLLEKYDKDKDGKIGRSEYPRGDAAFANLDRDKNGAIEEQDLGARPQRGPANRNRRGLGAAVTAAPKLPEVGDVAPDFDLPMLGMKDTTVKLSSFAGKQPVALIFGSYT
jgi:hypothetical protein